MEPMREPGEHPRAVQLFVLTFVLGWAFFLVPVPAGGKWTVPFDVLVSGLRHRFPSAVLWYTFVLTVGGALFTLLAPWWQHREGVGARLGRAFVTTRGIALLRVTWAVLAGVYLLGAEPVAWQQKHIGQLIWQVLAVSVAVIIPLGAVVVQLFVDYGGMEFLGVLARPIMQPLFRLPGRAALDALASWVGSYSVGLYITRSVFLKGGYSRRDVTIIATCFSTVSIGFVGVVAATLDLLPYFPLLVVLYFISVVGLTVVLVRIPPISRKPHTDVLGRPFRSEASGTSSTGSLLRRAWQAGVQQARKAPPLGQGSVRALGDGLVLAATILSTIVSVGTLALVLAHFTPLFQWLGKPVAVVLEALRIPGAGQIAPAVLVEVTEMYIPALLVVDAPLPGRFFIAVLSVSQLIFFSSLGPMILDMFRDVPITVKDLLWLFLLRTALLIPFLAVVVHLLMAFRVL